MSSRSSTNSPLAGFTSGNAVKLIRGGPDYFDLLERMIRSARHTIHFQVYIFEGDETGRRISNALMEAARRHVRVYLLVDAYGSKNLPGETVDELVKAGVHFRQFQPFMRRERFYFGRRLHHKVVVVDAWLSLIAGLNIGDRYNDTVEGRAWLDWAIYSEGEVSEALAKICLQRHKVRGHLSRQGEHPHLRLAGQHRNSAVRVRINDWVNRKSEISKCYLEMFRAAESQIILMSPYFLPGHEFKRSLRKAVERGVRIKVIQAGISDIPISKYAERYMYDWLLSNKVEIYEYQRSVLHGKIGVCDESRVTVGSYNLNNLSAFVSIELNLEVHDAAFARETNAQMENIIKQDCKRITRASFRRHTDWIDRVLQRFFYDMSRLILFLFSFYFKQKE